jgi:hypothetical protein
MPSKFLLYQQSVQVNQWIIVVWFFERVKASLLLLCEY